MFCDGLRRDLCVVITVWLDAYDSPAWNMSHQHIKNFFCVTSLFGGGFCVNAKNI
jgi:hypothetical protein